MVSTSNKPAPEGDAVVRYRKRSVGAPELSFLSDAIAVHGGQGRVHLSRVICEAWDWRQANGELSLAGCRDLLNHLAVLGHIELPKRRLKGDPRRYGSGGHPRMLREWIPLAWHVLGPGDIALDDVQVRPIAPEEADGWRLFVERYHYLGAGRMVGEHLRYVAIAGNEVVALLGWSAAALHVPAREAFIGWSAARKRDALHYVVNNARFLVLPWVRKPHLASKVLALCLRRLSGDWLAAWGHAVYLAESFVDPARFRGTCYRASNWRHIGRTAGRRRQRNAYLYDSTPKDVFVYQLCRHATKRLRGEV